MESQLYSFSYEVYHSLEDLAQDDAILLLEARKVSKAAYAPYSHFRVGAVARLAGGEIVTGTNQENASFPAGICAERVLLSAASSRYPDRAVEAIAISYQQDEGRSNHPISPCGICRQSLQEYEQRFKHPIRLILGGLEGKVYIVPAAGSLLPLAFTKDEMG
ncbi:MAG TPA: cytidine deaminase [Puia sp.]|nr:cytidine deaminase [Puia sp.]